ncbi:MAG TPA: CaiB/BaiF CoA-transferase family protein [Burkholderiales bacterium]|nr:CaiB/BaiF CoA-transferase family protein [Burkholderiales bacterium]
MSPPSANGPLAGLKILEFGQIAAGPFAGSLLADLGADVVKVEKPDGGDDMRRWPPMSAGPDGPDYSENFASVNRNKRSIAVDLKDAAQVARLRKLCEQADAIIENFRPGVLDRLGLDYKTLSAVSPKLVYCSINGYGHTGPYASKGAFDATVQGMSGLMSVTGESAGPPVKAGVPVGDFGAGLYGAFCVTAAILQAKQTGRGAFIDCSMLAGLLGIAALQTSEYFGTGKTPRRLGSAHPRSAPYQGYQASDAPFMIAAGNDKLWIDVCEAVGVPELKDDPRFATNTLRAKNQQALEQILQPVFSTRTKAEWLAEFDRRGVPCAPINTYPEILNDPHVQFNQLVRDMTLPNGKQTKTVAFPMKISGYEFSVYRHPPELGEHNDEVYAEWLAGK